jgi:hypothetical protein
MGGDYKLNDIFRPYNTVAHSVPSKREAYLAYELLAMGYSHTCAVVVFKYVAKSYRFATPCREHREYVRYYGPCVVYI